MKALSPREPKKIGDFTIVSRLGAGGMGDVYLGERDGENLAIKVIRDSFADDAAYVARFTREITILQTVSHPNVIGFVDSGLDDGRWWYASEFAHGPSLDVMVKKSGALGEDAWHVLASGLLAGLRAIHDHSIVHRDIKPANIIMSPYGPKIIDLGVARGDDETSLTNTGMAPGSPSWFSPEQVLGQEVTPASDYFSAGAVLTFAATGRGPWGTPSSVNYENIGTKIFSTPNLNGLSDAQRSLVAGLLESDPGKRVVRLPTKGTQPQTGVPRAKESTNHPAKNISAIKNKNTPEPGYRVPALSAKNTTRKRRGLAVASIGIVLLFSLSGIGALIQSSTVDRGDAGNANGMDDPPDSQDVNTLVKNPVPHRVYFLLPTRLIFDDARHESTGVVPCLPATDSSPIGDTLVLSSSTGVVLSEEPISGYLRSRISTESLSAISRQVGNRINDLGTLGQDRSWCVYSASVTHRLFPQDTHRLEIQGDRTLTKLTTRSELRAGLLWKIHVWP